MQPSAGRRTGGSAGQAVRLFGLRRQSVSGADHRLATALWHIHTAAFFKACSTICNRETTKPSPRNVPDTGRARSIRLLGVGDDVRRLKLLRFVSPKRNRETLTWATFGVHRQSVSGADHRPATALSNHQRHSVVNNVSGKRCRRFALSPHSKFVIGTQCLLEKLSNDLSLH